MVDEITSFNKECMPLCVHFVDSNQEIREKSSLAVYTNCTGHFWNLVFGSLLAVRSVINGFVCVCVCVFFFFLNSPKEIQLLIEIVEHDVMDAGN